MTIGLILTVVGFAAIGWVLWRYFSSEPKPERHWGTGIDEPRYIGGKNYDFHPRKTPQPEPRHYDPDIEKKIQRTVAPATPNVSPEVARSAAAAADARNEAEVRRRRQQQDDDDAAARRRRQQDDDDSSSTSSALIGGIIGAEIAGAFNSSSSSSSIDTGSSSIDAGGGNFGGGGADGSF